MNNMATMLALMLIAAGLSGVHGQNCVAPPARTYFKINQETPWASAEGKCKANGGFLASITSSAEQNTVNGLRRNDNQAMWIGAFRPCSRSQCPWEWSDGTPFSFSRFHSSGEGSTTQEENVVAMWNGGGFWDSWGTPATTFHTHVIACVKRCPADRYLDISSQQCCTRDQCPSGTYIEEVKVDSNVPVCSELKVCSGDQYESVAPTTTTDRECASLRVCANLEYESTAPTTTSNRECKAHSVCDPFSEFEVQAPTESSDRICGNLKVCSSGDEYESKKPTPSSDRECTRLTKCTETQFESTEATPSTDRVCQDLTVCESDEFELRPPTARDDRLCRKRTICDPGQISFLAPGAGDRICEDCPAGTVDSTGDEDDQPCNLCPAGHFAPQKAVDCAACLLGSTDDDTNSATPCVTCTSGGFVPKGSSGPCDAFACPAGTTDLDSDPSTECVPCAEGSFSPSSRTGDCIACSNSQFFFEGGCLPITQCTGFEFEIVAPTLTSDRRCSGKLQFLCRFLTFPFFRRSPVLRGS